MNYTTLFYWLTVADNCRTMFLAFIWIFTGIAVLVTIGYIVNGHQTVSYTSDEQDIKDGISGQITCRKWIMWSYPFMILFWGLYVFTPSKKDALLIVAGGTTMNFLTTNKDAKQLPADLVQYLRSEIRNLSKDADVELDIKDTKAKVIKEAKNMTTEQLLNKIKTDSSFAKILREE